MDTTQSINLLKGEKGILENQTSAINMAIGILEETLEFQSNELKDHYEDTIASYEQTISGLESSLSEIKTERDELTSERDALLDEKESLETERDNLLTQIQALSNQETTEA